MEKTQTKRFEVQLQPIVPFGEGVKYSVYVYADTAEQAAIKGQSQAPSEIGLKMYPRPKDWKVAGVYLQPMK